MSPDLFFDLDLDRPGGPIIEAASINDSLLIFENADSCDVWDMCDKLRLSLAASITIHCSHSC